MGSKCTHLRVCCHGNKFIVHLWRSDYYYRDRFLQLRWRERYVHLCEFTTALVSILSKHLPNIVTAAVIQGMEGKRILVANTRTTTLVASSHSQSSHLLMSSPFHKLHREGHLHSLANRLASLGPRPNTFQMKSGNETTNFQKVAGYWCLVTQNSWNVEEGF